MREKGTLDGDNGARKSMSKGEHVWSCTFIIVGFPFRVCVCAVLSNVGFLSLILCYVYCYLRGFCF